MDFVNWVLQHAGELVAILAGIVTIASVVTGLTKTTKDDDIVQKIKSVVDLLSFLKHKNAKGTFKAPLTKSAKSEEDVVD